MSSFDSDNDFMHEDYYETNGNFYTNGVYQGKEKFCAYFYTIIRILLNGSN